MNRFLALCSVLVLAWASFGAEGTAYSINTFAVVKSYSANTNEIIAVPWVYYSTNEVRKLPVYKLVNSMNLTVGKDAVPGDQLLVYKDNNCYYAWELKEQDQGTGLKNYWVPMKMVRRRTRIKSEGESAVTPDDEVVTNLMARGDGLWLVRHNPKAGEPFYLHGQYITDAGEILVRGTSSAGGEAKCCTMIAVPDVTQDVNVNEYFNWAEIADQIGEKDYIAVHLPSQTYKQYKFDKTMNKWWTTTMVGTGRDVETVKEFDIQLPAGVGFWYVRYAAGDLKLKFKEAYK